MVGYWGRCWSLSIRARVAAVIGDVVAIAAAAVAAAGVMLGYAMRGGQ